jgi:oxygen-independent coproporphyrinogen III oxidase
MHKPYERKDNEFVAWYPLGLQQKQAAEVWTKRPLAFYVHIPFCTAICDYCGFAIERAKGANIDRYVLAVESEIQRYAAAGRFAGYELACGHFGGGTPSVLDLEQLGKLKRATDAAFQGSRDVETTIEVNPISLTRAKAEGYLNLGFNRISVGIQSFNDQVLRHIGRPHRAQDVANALAVLREVRCTNYSLDIIYGVPAQRTEDVIEDLRRAVDSGAAHLSCFGLEIIPFTVLKLREAAGELPPRLSDEELSRMEDAIAEFLTAHGYRQYGAFNFARPGFESVHNKVAFMAPQAEYVGFGNSSYSFANGFIYCNYASASEYEGAVFAGKDPIALAKRVTQLEAMSRYFVLGLKFFAVPRAPFLQIFGIEPERVFGDVLEKLAESKLLELSDDHYTLTRLGHRYVNNIVKEFYVLDSCGRRQHEQFLPTLTMEQVAHYAKLVQRKQVTNEAEASRAGS